MQKRTPHEAVSSFLLRILSGSVAAALAVLTILFQLAHDGFRIDALTAVVVGQSSLDGLLGQNRAAVKAALSDYYRRQGIDPEPIVGKLEEDCDHCESCGN